MSNAFFMIRGFKNLRDNLEIILTFLFSFIFISSNYGQNKI